MSENKTQAEIDLELDLYIDRDKSKGVNPEKVTKESALKWLNDPKRRKATKKNTSDKRFMCPLGFLNNSSVMPVVEL